MTSARRAESVTADWGGRREGAGRGRVKQLDPAELRAYAGQRVSRARAAQLLGVGWAIVAREAARYGVAFASPRHYMTWPQTWATGERNGKAKLTAKQVEQIRASQAPTLELAARYRVNRTTIQDIRNGTTWKVA